MKTIRICFMLIALGHGSSISAYKEPSHAGLSEQAVKQSVLDQPGSGVLPSLGLGQLSNDRSSNLPANAGSPRTAILQGAVAEDRGIRSLNHFFDPQRAGAGLPIPTAHSSPEWALESSDPIEAQTFSYHDAKERLLTALTGATEALRKQELAAVFESLGHTVHHLQDMHQPQHVRSDDHCDLTQPILTVFGSVVIDSICKELHRYRPSAYEQYVQGQGAALGMSGYPTPDYATFDAPLKFWEGDGKGSAEFTSRNFVSVRTNFTLDTSNQLVAIRSNADHPWRGRLDFCV